MNETQLEQSGYYKDIDGDDLPENKRPVRFVKKPVVIEAMRWSGTNKASIGRFVKNLELLRWERRDPYFPGKMYIKTPEGVHEAEPGDYIIKGVAGEFYPCKPDIFMKTYRQA